MSLTFEEYLERTSAYVTAIREDGDLPWWEVPERREKVAARLGLSASTPPDEVRRALFDRHRSTKA